MKALNSMQSNATQKASIILALQVKKNSSNNNFLAIVQFPCLCVDSTFDTFISASTGKNKNKQDLTLEK